MLTRLSHTSFFCSSRESYAASLFASMPPETALELVYEALLGSNSIPQQLWARQGLDQRQFDELTAALRWLTHHYAAQPVVPKRLALCLVDVYGAFAFREGFYPPAERDKIEDAGLLLQDLATELFS
jgi:hypothetical protein